MTTAGATNELDRAVRVSGDEEIRAALYCAAEVVRSRRLKGQPVPRWLDSHLHLLNERVSRLRQESDCEATRSDDQHEVWISTREAGRILRRSQRQVQRIAEDLGGELVAGRWLFRRNDVEEYAEAMNR